MAIKCSECRGVTVNDDAPNCFVCGRRFPGIGLTSWLVIGAALAGLLLTTIVIAAQKYYR
jgi:hypothetical protein